MNIDDYLLGGNEEEETPVRIMKAWHHMPTTDRENYHYGKRGLDRVDKIIVHQAFRSNETTSFRDLAEYHITPSRNNHLHPQGAPAIGYHYGINRRGQIYRFHYHSRLTWHTHGENTWSIGICVLGDFDGLTYNGKDGDPTDVQIRSLYKLLKYLILEEDSLSIEPHGVWGHSDFGRENCPGIKINKFLEEFKKKFGDKEKLKKGTLI